MTGRGHTKRREQGHSFERKFLAAQKLATGGIDKAEVIFPNFDETPGSGTTPETGSMSECAGERGAQS